MAGHEVYARRPMGVPRENGHHDWRHGLRVVAIRLSEACSARTARQRTLLLDLPPPWPSRRASGLGREPPRRRRGTGSSGVDLSALRDRHLLRSLPRHVRRFLESSCGASPSVARAANGLAEGRRPRARSSRAVTGSVLRLSPGDLSLVGSALPFCALLWPPGSSDPVLDGDVGGELQERLYRELDGMGGLRRW